MKEFQGDGNHIYCPYGRLLNPITQSKAWRRAAGMLNKLTATATQLRYHNVKETSFTGNQSTEVDPLVSVGQTGLLAHLWRLLALAARYWFLCLQRYFTHKISILIAKSENRITRLCLLKLLRPSDIFNCYNIQNN